MQSYEVRRLEKVVLYERYGTSAIRSLLARPPKSLLKYLTKHQPFVLKFVSEWAEGPYKHPRTFIYDSHDSIYQSEEVAFFQLIV